MDFSNNLLARDRFAYFILDFGDEFIGKIRVKPYLLRNKIPQNNFNNYNFSILISSLIFFYQPIIGIRYRKFCVLGFRYCNLIQHTE